jgi:hypothetical protein
MITFSASPHDFLKAVDDLLGGHSVGVNFHRLVCFDEPAYRAKAIAEVGVLGQHFREAGFVSLMP